MEPNHSSGSIFAASGLAPRDHVGLRSPPAAQRSRGSNGAGNCYLSRDVVSDPPTLILIVRNHSEAAELLTANNCQHYVLESDVEPTEGWRTRHHKPNISICFMHSFGKCVGRSQSDPATCHQIHVKQFVVERLRSQYANAPRRFFSRTVKARLTPELIHVISQMARKELTIQYLEYLAQDVQETEGLHTYERSYRAWLYEPGGFQRAFHDTSVLQCSDFCLRGRCAADRLCPGVHAHLWRAQVRDALVLNAVRLISSQVDPATVPVSAPTVVPAAGTSGYSVTASSATSSSSSPQSVALGVSSSSGSAPLHPNSASPIPHFAHAPLQQQQQQQQHLPHQIPHHQQQHVQGHHHSVHPRPHGYHHPIPSHYCPPAAFAPLSTALPVATVYSPHDFGPYSGGQPVLLSSPPNTYTQHAHGPHGTFALPTVSEASLMAPQQVFVVMMPQNAASPVQAAGSMWGPGTNVTPVTAAPYFAQYVSPPVTPSGSQGSAMQTSSHPPGGDDDFRPHSRADSASQSDVHSLASLDLNGTQQHATAEGLSGNIAEVAAHVWNAQQQHLQQHYHSRGK